MPCCLVLGIVFASPRIIFVGLWLFTDYLTTAFNGGILWPLLGFVFAPITTMTYAIAENEFGGLQGWGVVVFAVGIVLDVLVYYSGRLRGEE